MLIWKLLYKAGAHHFYYKKKSVPCSWSLFSSVVKGSIQEVLTWTPSPPLLPPPSLSLATFFSCSASVWGKITIRLCRQWIIQMAEQEAERKRTRESIISDGSAATANDFHLIAPPPLWQRGRDKETWMSEGHAASANNGKPFSPLTLTSDNDGIVRPIFSWDPPPPPPCLFSLTNNPLPPLEIVFSQHQLQERTGYREIFTWYKKRSFCSVQYYCNKK